MSERERIIKLLRTNIEIEDAMAKRWIRWMYSSLVGFGKAGYLTGLIWWAVASGVSSYWKRRESKVNRVVQYLHGWIAGYQQRSVEQWEQKYSKAGGDGSGTD